MADMASTSRPAYLTPRFPLIMPEMSASLRSALMPVAPAALRPRALDRPSRILHSIMYLRQGTAFSRGAQAQGLGQAVEDFAQHHVLEA